MSTAKIRIAELALKHLTNDISEKESLELHEMRQDPANNKLFEELTDRSRLKEEVERMQNCDVYMHESWEKIASTYPFPTKKNPLKKYLAAAVILLLLIGAIALYFWLKQAKQIKPTVEPGHAPPRNVSNITPNRKAIWKRAANEAVFLDDVKKGVVGHAAGLPVIKNDSELVYSTARPNNISLPDTVQTLRGGYYRLQIPDASKIWINSASTVSFPSAFEDTKRKVSVDGEAYFEVVNEPNRPFSVQVSGLEIEMSGYKFNIRAYKDENIIRITSVEGKLKVNVGKQVTYLESGQQAILTREKKLQKITDPLVVKKAVSWKEGTFIFENENLKSILDELGRWYDLDIHYNGELSNNTHFGIFSRSDTVTEILYFLHSQTGIRYNLEGKKLIIQP